MFADVGLCAGTLHCVNVNKLIFGQGTKVHVYSSKYNSLHPLRNVIQT